MQITKRARKSAKIKLDILLSTVQLVGKKSFNDLYVDDICAKAGTSKVTFFKYFPQKEDVLLYYLRIWCLDRAVELNVKPREGMQGLYYLAEKLSDAYDKHPGLILNLISYWTSEQRPPNTFPVKPAERYLLYPKIKEWGSIDILSLPMLVEKFVLETVLTKQSNKHHDPSELANLLLSVLYGSIVTAHTRQVHPIRTLFRRNIDSIFK